MMERYSDLNGDSGIYGYEIGDDYIIVQFKTGAIYTYSDLSAGKATIDIMKSLAKTGDGLNAFIKKHANKLYVK